MPSATSPSSTSARPTPRWRWSISTRGASWSREPSPTGFAATGRTRITMSMRSGHSCSRGLAALRRGSPIDAISVTTHGATAALVDVRGELVLPVLDYEFDGPDEMRDAYESGAGAIFRNRIAGTAGWAQSRRAAVLAATAVLRRLRRGPGNPDLPAVLDDEAHGRCSERSHVTGLPHRSLEPACTRLLDAGRRDGLAPPVPADAPRGRHAWLAASGDSNAHRHRSRNPRRLRHPRFQCLAAAASGDAQGRRSRWYRPAPGWFRWRSAAARRRLDPARDTLVNVNAFGDPVPSARFMGGREFERLVPDAGNATDDDWSAVLSGSVMLLPSVSSGSGPFPARPFAWHPAEPMGPERRTAASFYLALMTATCLDLVGAAGEIVVEGPFAGNGAYLAMLAAATGMPVAAQRSSTGTSLGAALLLTGVCGMMPGRMVQTSGHDSELQSYARQWNAAVQQATP